MDEGNNKAQVTEERLTAAFTQGFNETLEPQLQMYRLRIKVEETKIVDEVMQRSDLVEKLTEFLDEFGGVDLHIKIDSIAPKE